MSLKSRASGSEPGGTPAPVRRRRGSALEEALLDAAWAELVEVGYDRLTVDAVAERAGTSRAVLYRRYAGKPELVRAAALRTAAVGDEPTPDTGSLRGDLVELLRRVNTERARMGIELLVRLGPYFAQTGTGVADLRAELLADRDSQVDLVLDRAVARGEVDATRLAPRVRSLPFDLFRHELLTTLRPVPDGVVDELLDEVFLPLVRG